MFLSKLTLDLRNSRVRYDLARPYEMHRTLMNAYPYDREENRCDLLFRMETLRTGQTVVLVQTRQKPDWSALSYSYLRAVESKPLVLPLTPGHRLCFRLRANPTKRVAAKNERLGSLLAGKRIGLATETDQLRWLLRKGETGGFRLPGEWIDARHPETGEAIQIPNFRVDVVPEGRARNDKPGHQGEFTAVRFDGVLVVTHPETFRHTVSCGIGSAKTYGFGLLSLAPGSAEQ